MIHKPGTLASVLWLAAVVSGVSPAAGSDLSRTRVSLVNGKWHFGGQVTYRGSAAEGLLMNVRMVNAVFEDRKKPAFDPEANTDRFVARIPDYAAHGVNAFTICLQGGMPGYEGALNSAFEPDGGLRPAYLARVERLIRACDRHGVAVILGLYYQRQSAILRDEAAVRTGVVNAAHWVRERGFRNVLLEIANEYPHQGFAHAVIRDPKGQASLIQLAKAAAPGLLVSASGYGDGRVHREVAEAADFLLPHWNGTTVEQIPERIATLKKFGKPIVCNEDDKTGTNAVAALRACVTNGASYGLMLKEQNQTFPFRFDGAADDPVFYAELSRLTTRRRAATPAGDQGTADFFVSLGGEDTWSGKLADPGQDDGPFATVARAREAVRTLLKTRKEPRPVRVVLRGGTYYLDSALEFGPEDSGTEQSPVVYAAARGEKVVLSGGRRLTGGRWGEANGRKAWLLDLPEVKDGTWRFRQLFVNGERRPRTRLPKQGEYRIESLPGYTGDFLRSPTKQFVYAPGHLVPTWRNLRDVEVVGITRWLDNRLPIESVNGETRTVTFDRPSLFALVSSAPWGDSTTTPSVYWVENVSEALNTPGHWYLDRPAGRLACLPRPGEDMTTAEIIAPRLLRVVQVVGRPGAPAHDLRFEGLTFSHTEWQPPPDYASSLQAGIEVPGALFFDYAERCAVSGGSIEHIGNFGVEVGVGCADIEVSHNRITDIGAGGIRIGHFFSWETDGSGQLTERGKQRKAAMPQGPHSQRITVADNVIAHCGRFTPEAMGVFVGDNAHVQIIHNHIYDLFQCAIAVGSVQDFGPSEARDNIIEYNHIHDVGQGMLSDVAGIYTCSSPGSRIRFNQVHDVSRRDYGGWGIYPDQGSHDLLVQNNLVYHCQDGALFAHHNQNITTENNIFAFSRTAQIERYGMGGFELTCRRNLICYREGLAIGSNGIETSGTNVCVFDRNLYWNASGQPVLFGDKSFAAWQAKGQDTNSVVADPLFVDPAHGDFRLQPASPATKIGFEPWDLKAVGPQPVSAKPR